jgi:L-ascorbate metabolism protein UlaG (beta-lactamase superfamily)
MPALTFLGHAAFALDLAKARLLIDPFLTGNPLARAKPEETAADYILLTHGHPDHVGDGVAIALRTGATIVAPFELATWCQGQGAKAHPMHIGGAHDFPFGRVKLTIAVHGSGYPTEHGILYMGNPCGFLIAADGKTVYHAGDTGLFYDMKLIGETNRIDVALLPIGGNFTMDVPDAVRAAVLLGAGLSIPMHYGTFDVIDADPAAFVEGAAAKGLRAMVLGVGERAEI